MAQGEERLHMKGIESMSLAFRRVLIAAMIAFVAGCSSGPTKYPVVIAPHPSIEGSILVDVIGATKSDLSDWESYPVTKYFQADNPKRRDADKVTFKIVPGQTQRLETTDEIWARWDRAGVSHLVIMADLPNVAEDAPRRKILSLYPDDWVGAKQLDVEIQQSGIRVLTRQRAQR